MPSLNSLKRSVVESEKQENVSTSGSIRNAVSSTTTLDEIQSGGGASVCSFLCCVVCSLTPVCPPLYGCREGHVICCTCRDTVGVPDSCPMCGAQDLNQRLSVTESLLAREHNQGTRCPCPHEESGCGAILERSALPLHTNTCLFRPRRCPKAMFSASCTYKGPLCTIQAHGRSQHQLHKGVTVLDTGYITSKMFDKGWDESLCDDPVSAKFQPLELVHGEDVFYCYMERVAVRKVWFFFVRSYSEEEGSCDWRVTISVGGASLDRNDRQLASHVYRGNVAPYYMSKEEIRKQGLILTVPDEVMRAGRRDNVLFRMWVQLEEMVGHLQKRK